MSSLSPNHPERQYLELLQRVLETGDRRVDRTGVGTLSVLGAMCRFDLSQAAPVLTTKQVYWKTAVKEMLWFLTGGTNIRALLQQNVRIWSDWPLARYRKETGESISQEDFEGRILEDTAFAARWGELGPVYGKQWRRWLGPDGRKHDQIAHVLHLLKTNQASRRILFHAWNVGEIEDMALPPCHMVYQYHVARGRLNCMLYQRSVDLVLGAPFNWVGATALQLMLAQLSGLAPGELVWTGADVHVYLNHIEQARLQLGRQPRPWPRMTLAPRERLEDYVIDDFALQGYDPHPAIRADVAV